MTRPPKTGDALECTLTNAVFSVVGVRESGRGAGGLGFDAVRWEIAMVCVVAPYGMPTLGDMHLIGGTWGSLEGDYTLLTV